MNDSTPSKRRDRAKGKGASPLARSFHLLGRNGFPTETPGMESGETQVRVEGIQAGILVNVTVPGWFQGDNSTSSQAQEGDWTLVQPRDRGSFW